MAMLHRTETSSAPLATHGRTITLVARTRAIGMSGRSGSALHVRARPSHVEVLDEQGRHEVVRIRDIEGTLIVAIVAAGIVGALVTRARRNA